MLVLYGSVDPVIHRERTTFTVWGRVPIHQASKVSGILCQSSAWCPPNEDGQPRQFALAFNLMELRLCVEGNRLYRHAVTAEDAAWRRLGRQQESDSMVETMLTSRRHEYILTCCNLKGPLLPLVTQ